MLHPVSLLLVAATLAGAAELKLVTTSQDVPRFARIEFDLNARTDYPNLFDPAVVDITLELAAPGGERVVVPAFPYQAFERRGPTNGLQRDWLYPLGAPKWKARFAPAVLGRYKARALVKDANGENRSQEITFNCVPSPRQGFIRIAKKDPRFLEFDNGQPFFAIGQNLAFIGDQQYVTLTKADGIFGKLSDNGANYLRVWTCANDWALAIEARKSAWGRSWSGKGHFEPLPAEPGRKCVILDAKRRAEDVSPSHPVALRPDTEYIFTIRGTVESNATLGAEFHGVRATLRGTNALRRCQFRTGPTDHWLGKVRLELEGDGRALISDVSLTEAGGGPELLWEAEMNRPDRGFYNPVDCFILDELLAAAEQRGIYLQLCMLTRDLYMNAVQDASATNYARAVADAKKFFRHAIARWGYSTSVAAWEYWNEMNPALPTDRFYNELGAFFETADPYHHLRATSTWGPSAKDCKHPRLDFADVHFYLRPADKARLSNEVDAILERTRWLREQAPNKPAHLGEFGLADDKWQITEDMKRLPDITDVHNALWASALSGASGTALEWWWERIDQRDGYKLYGPVSRFIRDIPWNSGSVDSLAATISDESMRVIGLRAGDRAWLWLFDPAAAWEKVAVEKSTPPPRSDLWVEISGISGPRRVSWIDTRTEVVLREETVSPTGDRLRISAPPFTRDIACQLQ